MPVYIGLGHRENLTNSGSIVMLECFCLYRYKGSPSIT